jgi:hypothetical protein
MPRGEPASCGEGASRWRSRSPRREALPVLWQRLCYLRDRVSACVSCDVRALRSREDQFIVRRMMPPKKHSRTCPLMLPPEPKQVFLSSQTTHKIRIVLLINIVTVDPAHQRWLVNLLPLATDSFVSCVRLYLFTAPSQRQRHKSRHVMYKWRGIEDYEVMRQNRSPPAQ